MHRNQKLYVISRTQSGWEREAKLWKKELFYLQKYAETRLYIAFLEFFFLLLPHYGNVFLLENDSRELPRIWTGAVDLVFDAKTTAMFIAKWEIIFHKIWINIKQKLRIIAHTAF